MQLSKIDTNLLLTLDALLREASVQRAARRIARSASATSHALARLRELFADPLLMRAGRHLVLTPKARRLMPKVRQAVQSIEQVFTGDEKLDPSMLRRTFRISTTDHLMTVLRRGHPALKKKLTLKRFVELQHVLVAPCGEPGSYVDDALAQLGLQRRVVRSVSTFLAAPFLVAETDYAMTFSARIAARLAPMLGLEVVKTPLKLEPFTITQVWHEQHQQDPAHEWFRDLVLRTAAGLPEV